MGQVIKKKGPKGNQEYLCPSKEKVEKYKEIVSTIMSLFFLLLNIQDLCESI